MNTKTWLALPMAASTLLTAPAIWAQTPSVGALEEVVVTAQKREENLQQTPIAITALNPQDMARQGVRDFTNLDKLVPDVSISRTVGSMTIGIRGIFPVANSPTTESPNAVHIDGAYIDRPSGLDGLFYDVQRVEVLKGPQGTLYGRNTASGAVNILTNNPGPQFAAGIDAEVGNYSLRRVEGMLNVPVSDSFALRLAVRDYEHDGYYRQTGFSDANQKSARLKGLWKISDADRLLMSADYQRIRQGGTPGSTIVGYTANTVPSTAVPKDPFDPTAAVGTNGDPYFFDVNHWGLMAQYDHDFEPATLTVQLAHRDLEVDQAPQGFAAASVNGPNPFTPPSLPVSTLVQPTWFHNTVNSNWSSLEARLTSSSKAPLEWVAGLYAFRASTESVATQYQPTPTVFPLVVPPFFEVANPLHHSRSYAAFGQATWTPLDPLHITLGVRYNYDWKEAAVAQSFFGGPRVYNPTTFPTNGDTLEDHWTKTTGRLGVSYDLTSSNMVYASVSTGYQAGGYGYGTTPKFEPEKNTAYEVGSKNRFFNDRLQVNADFFYYDYKNKVINIFRVTPQLFGPPLFDLSVTNAGKLRYEGGSVDVLWAATSADTFNISAAYLSARYLDFITSAGGPGQAMTDASDTPQIGPKWTGKVNYMHTLTFSAGTLDLNIGAQYRGKTLLTSVVSQCGADATLVNCAFPIPTAQPARFYGDDYWIGDVSLRYAPTGGKWSVTAYVNNVTDEQKVVSQTILVPNSTFYPQEGVLTGVYTQPRTYGAIVSFKF